jgi:hypothetical protein
MREEAVHVLTHYVQGREDLRAWTYLNARKVLKELNAVLEPGGWKLVEPNTGKLVCNQTEDEHPRGEFITAEEYGYGPSLVRL